MKSRFTLLLSVFCLVFFSGVLQAQTAEKIIKTHIKKAGYKKYKKVETIKITGNMPTPQGDFPITSYSKKPNKTKVKLDIQGMEMVASAFDGTTAWTLNPFMGSSTPTKLPADQAKLVAEQAQFEPLYVDYAAKGYTITLDGTEDVKGKSCYKLVVEKPGLDKQYHYIDAETYMLTKVNAVGGDGSRGDTYFGDYKKTDFGVMMPYSMEISTQMGPMQIIYSEIIANEPIADEEFAYTGS